MSWMSIGVYGCLCVHNGVYRYLWVSIDFYGFSGCILMLPDVYGFLYVPMGVYGFLGVYRYLWVSWVSMGIFLSTKVDSRTLEYTWNQTWATNNSGCATRERDFNDSCVFNPRLRLRLRNRLQVVRVRLRLILKIYSRRWTIKCLLSPLVQNILLVTYLNLRGASPVNGVFRSLISSVD